MESAALTSLDDVLDLDLASLGRGESVGLTLTQEPIFGVCTHGRHDACCAERGRPVVAALTRDYAASTWEISHIGGDRFAANLVVLPHGLYYGRVEPDRVRDLIGRHLEGHLTLDLWRGRSAYPFTVQAGEYYLRRELGETRIDAVSWTGSRRLAGPGTTDGTWHLSFASASGIWAVRVRASENQPDLLTCRALVPSASPRFTLLGIDPPG